MLNRKELKKSARQKLHLNRFFLLVMFVALSIEGGGTKFYSIFIFLVLNSDKSPQVILIKIIFKIIFSLALCFSISNIVHLIRDSIYLEMAKSEKKLDTDAVPEKIEKLWLFGFVSGWFLFAKIILYVLFFPAAIIKWIEYSQTFFILADNPKIGVKAAMRASQRITEGRKKELAFLFLSFSGWFILTLSSFGIVIIYLIPYMRLTFANAYLRLKEDAIKSGKIATAF